MLENLIGKYKDNDVSEVVYRLSYSGKFIIIKGKTLAGSLIIIANTFDQYESGSQRFTYHLYRFLYEHYIANECGRFRIKTIAKKGPKVDQYQLLRREQMELDRNRYNPRCLNNSIESYIPLFNKKTNMYGWIEKDAAMNFKKHWLDSDQRIDYIKRYRKYLSTGKKLPGADTV